MKPLLQMALIISALIANVDCCAKKAKVQPPDSGLFGETSIGEDKETK